MKASHSDHQPRSLAAVTELAQQKAWTKWSSVDLASKRTDNGGGPATAGGRWWTECVVLTVASDGVPGRSSERVCMDSPFSGWRRRVDLDLPPPPLRALLLRWRESERRRPLPSLRPTGKRTPLLFRRSNTKAFTLFSLNLLMASFTDPGIG